MSVPLTSSSHSLRALAFVALKSVSSSRRESVLMLVGTGLAARDSGNSPGLTDSGEPGSVRKAELEAELSVHSEPKHNVTHLHALTCRAHLRGKAYTLASDARHVWAICVAEDHFQGNIGRGPVARRLHLWRCPRARRARQQKYVCGITR